MYLRQPDTIISDFNIYWFLIYNSTEFIFYDH